MDRRHFLRWGIGTMAAGGGILAGLSWPRESGFGIRHDTFALMPPAYSVIPVVGDGKWIWTEPPKGQTGYLEPRQFDLNVGVQLRGAGAATSLQATTTVPVELPEQQIDDVRIETQGCLATLRQLAPEAGQLLLAAPSIVAGQVIAAVAHFRLTLFKQYQGYRQEMFPVDQALPKDIRKLYLYDSPGIQTRGKEVRVLANEIAGQLEHPWEKAQAFHKWVWEQIKPRVQYYTSVIAALRDRVGDCEERAAVFVAFCRAVGIPARLVWVPNHNWAEFYLHDEDGHGHWIPAHTSAYSWFGWTGAHELVLQKGDNLHVPEKSKGQRLLADWMQWQGGRPKVQYLADLQPVAPSADEDAGPGARNKDAKGEWLRTGNHPLDKFARQ